MRGHTRIILIWQYITYDRSLFIFPFVFLMHMEVARCSLATIAILLSFSAYTESEVYRPLPHGPKMK
jgi:hypothetical protein